LIVTGGRNREMSSPLYPRQPALRRAILWATLASVLLLGACSRGPEPLSADQLRIRINLLCSTCDDFLQCRANASTDGFTLYRLREKSVWAQVATIWDYLIQALRRKTSDQRPLTVYAEQNGLRVVRSTTGAARVDLVSGLISLPDSLIDLRDGSWRSLQGEVLGGCVSMPRREGYAWVRELLGRPLPGATP
jgi:hypothetical protein